jgi:UDPglucose 6-dehydrogenase
MAQIAVIGSGFVGQATGRGFARHGNKVTFYDIDPAKVETLRSEGFGAELVQSSTTIDADVVMLCVPTPTHNDKIDLSIIESAAKWIGQSIRQSNKYQLVVVRSTVLPGTTEKLVLKLIEQGSGKKAGTDFGLAMQPEYLRQVTANEDFERPWFVLIGQYDKKSGDILEKLYVPFAPPYIERCTIREAETQKYIHNLYNAVKISFFNEMRTVCENESLDADKIFLAVAESCEGIWNPLYGLRDKGPFDGACLPKDTQAFAAWSQKNGHEVAVLIAAIEQNKQHAKRKKKSVPVGA